MPARSAPREEPDVTPNRAHLARARRCFDKGLTGVLAEGMTADQVAATVNWSPAIVPPAPAPAPETVVVPHLTG